jgi:uncharacterized protein (DUF2235 family)
MTTKNSNMKRIIACTDGTWNRPGMKDRGKPVQTNVEKMFNAICRVGEDNIHQLKAYDEGVGTSYTLRDKLLGGIAGEGLDRHIRNMYFFISINYEPGDELYLYGFSRGAYTARSLAGFIRNCGLLQPQYIHLLDRAFELYRDRNSYTTPDSDVMIAFKYKYSIEPEIPIKFMGVWDTVGALGIPLPFYKMHNMQKYKFHDHKLSPTVEYAYHALAIDDRRKLFEPTLWELSDTVRNDPMHKQVLEQRWFAGSHSNVGGGYVDSGLSDIALQWLIRKASDTGLCFDSTALGSLQPNYKGELRNSYTAKYMFWPRIWRKVNTADANGYQTIDDSVMERYKADKRYRPRNIRSLIK